MISSVEKGKINNVFNTRMLSVSQQVFNKIELSYILLNFNIILYSKNDGIQHILR